VNSQTFQTLNQRYFAGRLPLYQVIVAPLLQHAAGKIARRSHWIHLQPAPPDVLLNTLLHEMAHAATNDHHGPRWRADMRRLKALGALVEDADDYEDRISLTRQLAFDVGYDTFFIQPTLTNAQVVRWIQHSYGFSHRHSLMRAYPWVRHALHDARQKAAEHRQRRERQLAAQRG
jgi:SprT-like family